MSSGGSGSLARYIVVRILLIVPMLLVLLTMTFLLLRVAPGDPVSAAVGGKLDPAVLAQKQAALGLDRPLYVQYFEYLGQVLRGNFGTTISDNQPVVDVIRDKFGVTLMLTLGAFVVALGVGLPLGRLSGRRRDSPADAGIRVFGIVTLRRSDLLGRRAAGGLRGGPLPVLADVRRRLGADHLRGADPHPHPDRRRDLCLGLAGRLRHPPAHGAAVRDPRAAPGRRDHPAGPGQRHPDAARATTSRRPVPAASRSARWSGGTRSATPWCP